MPPKLLHSVEYIEAVRDSDQNMVHLRHVNALELPVARCSGLVSPAPSRDPFSPTGATHGRDQTQDNCTPILRSLLLPTPLIKRDPSQSEVPVKFWQRIHGHLGRVPGWNE